MKTLPVELQQKVMAIALARAAKPLVNAAKMFALRSKRTGALVESLGAIVKKDKSGGAYAVIGPRRGYFRGGKKLGKGEDARGADAPANYAHLVEFGHRTALGGTLTRKSGRGKKGAGQEGKFVPPRPFMRPALLAAGDAVATELANGVSDGIARTLQRIVKNPASRG